MEQVDQDPEPSQNLLCDKSGKTGACLRACKFVCSLIPSIPSTQCYHTCALRACKCPLRESSNWWNLLRIKLFLSFTAPPEPIEPHNVEQQEEESKRDVWVSKTKVGNKITSIAGDSSDDDDEPSSGAAASSCGSGIKNKLCVSACKKGCSALNPNLQGVCIKQCAKRVCHCELNSNFWRRLERFENYRKHLFLANALQMKFENGQQQVVVNQQKLENPGKIVSSMQIAIIYNFCIKIAARRATKNRKAGPRPRNHVEAASSPNCASKVAKSVVRPWTHRCNLPASRPASRRSVAASCLVKSFSVLCFWKNLKQIFSTELAQLQNEEPGGLKHSQCHSHLW